MPCRIVKLGGSLLDWAPLREAVPTWLGAQPPAKTVFVVGGGDLAEALRRLDQCLALGEETSHWLCIRAMGVTARLAAALWPQVTLATQLAELADPPGGTWVLDTEDFLRREEPYLPGARLEHRWSVTSDSIAARVAQALGADELVLLKSALPPASPLACKTAAAAGYVDGFFPQASQGLPLLRAVNLRATGFPEAVLTPEPRGATPAG